MSIICVNIIRFLVIQFYNVLDNLCLMSDSDLESLIYIFIFGSVRNCSLVMFGFIYLENTITNVVNWMSFNFLSLNPSKTEFLIFGLPQQLSKLNNPTIDLPNNVILSPVDSARNLGVIFDKICHLRKISLLFLNHASSIFVT